MRKVDAVMHGAKALSNETRVVPAEWYRFVDCGTGGIVGSDIQAEDTFEIVTAARGADIYFCSGDSLDDSIPEAAEETRIWWRARVID